MWVLPKAKLSQKFTILIVWDQSLSCENCVYIAGEAGVKNKTSLLFEVRSLKKGFIGFN